MVYNTYNSQLIYSNILVEFLIIVSNILWHTAKTTSFIFFNVVIYFLYDTHWSVSSRLVCFYRLIPKFIFLDLKNKL